mgnify:CR=1 FL=1
MEINMLSIHDINLLQAQNEGLKKQNETLQQENKLLREKIKELDADWQPFVDELNRRNNDR